MTSHASNTPTELRDLWATPQFVFDYLNREFGFVMDLAASSTNTKCPFYFDESANSLSKQWPAVPGWLNPPYSKIGPWVEKSAVAHLHGTTVVMLVPADPSVEWFRTAWLSAHEMRFISGRLAFISAETGKPVSGNNKGSVIIIWRPGARTTDGPIVSLIQREAMRS